MIFRLIFISFISLLTSANTAAAPKLVVSIKPIHSIVSNITQGITTPALLLENNQSAHHFHLKPSQISLIEQADLVISIHPNFEEGLAKALSNINNSQQLLVNSNDTINHHTWLDINHMQDFSKLLTDKLIQIDASNSATYQNNLILLNQKLGLLKHDTSQQLSKYSATPIATFSNTFEYFIDANQLQKPTIVTQSHGERLSIHKILNAKKTMQKQQTKCLLSTIEIPKKRIKVLIEGLDVNTESIDIIGFNIDKGTQHYFDLINTTASKVSQCLK